MNNYAFIKNRNVENIAVFENLTTELYNSFIETYQLDDIVLCNENSEIGGLYENGIFWKKQPYPSWIKNEILNIWQAPVSIPEEIPNKYVWNEELLSWETKELPEKEYESWVFDYNFFRWKPPVEYPNDGNNYVWNEETVSWQLTI